MNTYDYILLGIIGVFAITGYRKGLVMSVLGLLSWIISFLIAKAITPVAVMYIKTTELYNSLGNAILKKFAPLKTQTTDGFMGALNNGTVEDKGGLIKSLLSRGMEDGKIFDASSMVAYLSQSITDMLITVVCAILIFIICRILVSIVLKLIKGVVSSLPVIKHIDKFGGIMFGLAEGILIAYIIVMLLSVLNVSGFSKGNDSGVIGGYFMSLNLFELIVNNFIA